MLSRGHTLKTCFCATAASGSLGTWRQCQRHEWSLGTREAPTPERRTPRRACRQATNSPRLICGALRAAYCNQGVHTERLRSCSQALIGGARACRPAAAAGCDTAGRAEGQRAPAWRSSLRPKPLPTRSNQAPTSTMERVHRRQHGLGRRTRDASGKAAGGARSDGSCGGAARPSFSRPITPKLLNGVGDRAWRRQFGTIPAVAPSGSHQGS